jgi:L,D-transpeptidase ErfK/SrfK
MIYSSRYLRITEPLMRGPDIAYIQERLISLGYYDGLINSTYDLKTEEAVRNFQKEFGLMIDGIVGPDTYNAIGLNPEDILFIPTEGYIITIDTDNFILSLSQFGNIINTFPIAVGTPGTPSPLGSWNIIQKTENPGGPFGTRWIKLSVSWGGYGIHGTNNPSSIGTASSHGCIRMNNDDVIILYNIIPLRTPVQIIGKVFTGRILKIGVLPGEDISEVQRILQVLGYYRADIDGYYGPITEEAVKNFQRNNNLTADGIVGHNTYNALQREIDIALDNTLP